MGATLLVVHAGAGDIPAASRTEAAILQTLQSALRAAATAAAATTPTTRGQAAWTPALSVADRACAAVEILEHAACTNAGLHVDHRAARNEYGDVSADATMAVYERAAETNKVTWGSVGAMEPSRNTSDAAIHAAHMLQMCRQHGLSDRTRMTPSVLVGPGASSFVCRATMTHAEQSRLESYARRLACDRLLSSSFWTQVPDSVRYHSSHAATLPLANDTGPELHANLADGTGDEHGISLFSDTVGCIVVDSHGNVAAASSSGGAWLKPLGTISSAAIYGAGTFVSSTGAACASGMGDAIIEHALARRALHLQDDEHCLADALLATRALAGIVSCTFLPSGQSDEDMARTSVAMNWAHTVPTFALGYAVVPDDCDGDQRHTIKVQAWISRYRQSAPETSSSDLVDASTLVGCTEGSKKFGLTTS